MDERWIQEQDRINERLAAAFERNNLLAQESLAKSKRFRVFANQCAGRPVDSIKACQECGEMPHE